MLPLLAALGIVLPTPTRTTRAEALLARYQLLTREHYLPVASLQMGVVRGTADLIGQHMHGANVIDGMHAGAMVITGLSISGAGGAAWLRHLERALGPSEGKAGGVLLKTVLDYVCWAPVVNTANLFTVSLFMVCTPAAVATAALHPPHPPASTA